MKKLAMWLNEHAICLGDSIKANVVHLWCILISFVLITVFAACKCNGKILEYLLMFLLLGGTVIPPIVEAIRALIKRESWTPWYWFPIAIGNAIGCLISIIIGLIFSYVKF
jgi:hypothetical protein